MNTQPNPTDYTEAPEFDEVYRRHQLRITRIVATQVRRFDQADVDDLVQITFLRAWRALPGFVGKNDPDAISAWLVTIARHVVCDHYRKGPALQRAAERPTGTEHPIWSTTAAVEADHADRVCGLVDIATSMRASAGRRQAIQLRVVDERSWAQAAASMRRGKAAVRRLVGEVIGS